MTQGTTPTLLFKFSFDLALAKEWRIIFYQDEENNFPKTQNDCIVDENQVIYIKLTQEETLSFDTNKYLKIQAKALTNDNNVIPSDTITTHIHEILDKALFEIENTPPTIIDTSVIEFTFNKEHCQFGIDFDDLYIEPVGGGADITVDKELSLTSTNPVQNKVVTQAINNLDRAVNQHYQDVNNHITQYEEKVDHIEEVLDRHTEEYEQKVDNMESDIYRHLQEYESRVEDLENNKQDKLEFDTVVTQGSENPITSGAVANEFRTFSQSYDQKIENDITSAVNSANQYSDNVGESANSYTDQELEKLSVKYKSFNNGDTITVEDNTIYTTTDTINNLTILYPTGTFICSFIFTVGDLTQGAISFPTNDSKYIGKAPDLTEAGVKWELNIHNGIIAAGKVVSE